MISVKNLSVKTATGRRLFDGFDLEVRPGETVALMGESGVGKSTIAKLLLGECPRGLVVSNGEISVLEHSPLQLSGGALRCLRQRISYIDQDPGAALTPHMTLRQLFAERSEEDPVHVMQALEIDQLIDALPSALSGGQRRRAAIVRGLVSSPEVVIFDEPTAGLDSKVLCNVGALLKTLKSAAIIVITHDEQFAQEFADRTVYLGSPPSAARNTRSGTHNAESAVFEVRELLAGHGNGPRPNPLNLKIHAGEVIAISGPSGCGKTTLLRAMLGLHTPDSGAILLHGEQLPAQLRQRNLGQRRSIGWVPQDAALSLNPAVNIGRLLRRRASTDDMSILERLRIAQCVDSKPRELSGGQRQRVLFAAAVLQEPSVLLLDEATSALDSETRDLVLAEVDRLCQQGVAVLAVSHESEICAWADQTIEIERH